MLKKLNKNVDIKRIIDNIYVNKCLFCIILSILKIKRFLNWYVIIDVIIDF